MLCRTSTGVVTRGFGRRVSRLRASPESLSSRPKEAESRDQRLTATPKIAPLALAHDAARRLTSPLLALPIFNNLDRYKYSCLTHYFLLGYLFMHPDFGY